MVVVQDFNNMRPTIQVIDLGMIDYQKAWDLQTRLHDFLVRRKRNLLTETEKNMYGSHDHFMLICEHNPVYTLGKSGSIDHLKLNEVTLLQGGFNFYKINRGGDITYHGPGQLVVYPILDLDQFFTDVHRYVRSLEEAIMQVLTHYNIDSYRDVAHTGVWVKFESAPFKRKICAIGVHLSRWVSMHGLAFNLSPEMSHFKNIVPCGIQEDSKDVCSMEQILGIKPDRKELTEHFIKIFSVLFDADIKVQQSSLFLEQLESTSQSTNA
jgi:lipoyl(octanoyl) transferase